MIGELAAATGRKQRKTGVEQVCGSAAGPGGVDRGMFQQPDELWRLLRGDIGNPRLHGGHSFGIGHRRVGYPPFDRAAACRARKGRQIESLPGIYHWLTTTS